MKNRKANSSQMAALAITGIGFAALTCSATAHAGCGVYEAAKSAADTVLGEPRSTSRARFLQTVFQDELEDDAARNLPRIEYSIVGLWKIKLTAKGNPKIPDGAEIDFGYQAWHSDGTEILNSGSRPPMTQSFCMGAWERVGHHHFVLNHVTLSWDSTGTVYVGPGNIKEEIWTDPSGTRFAGTFEIIQYSTDEKTVLADIKGVTSGERVAAR